MTDSQSARRFFHLLSLRDAFQCCYRTACVLEDTDIEESRQDVLEKSAKWLGVVHGLLSRFPVTQESPMTEPEDEWCPFCGNDGCEECEPDNHPRQIPREDEPEYGGES